MPRMVDMDRLQQLFRLHRMGSGGREVARLLGMSPNTERMYRIALEAAGLLSGPIMDLPALERLKAAVEERLPRKPSPQQTSSLETWLEKIEELWKKGVGPRAIYDTLRLEDEQFREARATLSAVSASACGSSERAACSPRTSRSRWRRRPATSRRSTSATSAASSTRAPA